MTATVPVVRIAERSESRHHVLLWQVHGASDVIIAGEDLVLHAGTAVWVAAGTIHGLTTRPDSAVLPLFFDVATTTSGLPEAAVFAIDGHLEKLLLVAVWKTYTIVEPDLDVDAEIVRLLERRPHAPAALPLPRSEAARQIAEQLLQFPGDPRPIEQLAASAYVSARTIERTFREETGMTLRSWRLQNRMHMASTMLRRQEPVEQVARAVGYRDANAFRRAFKARFDTTPGAYARAHPLAVGVG